MDFLDPAYERRSRTRLVLGYGLVALAIGIATLVLLYTSYGFGVNSQGAVIQNGLLFVSSQPDGAGIYLDGKRYKSDTNSRVTAPAAPYTLKIAKAGYRSWQRPVWVAGGDVQHFDYPFLFPQNLRTTTLADLDAAPSLATQSPDRRWLLLGRPDVSGSFTLYDLKNPAKPAATAITLPDNSFAAVDGQQSWSTMDWASDNRHVLLLHTYTLDGASRHEYVVLDRGTPADSVNVTNTLDLSQDAAVDLFNGRTSQLYVYDSTDQTLQRVNSGDGAVVSRLEHVLAYKTYADNKILYVTDQPPTGKATPGQISVVLQDGQQTYTLRALPPAGNGTYLLDLAQYAGDWYVAVAATTGSTVYVYKNPQTQLSGGPDTYPAPWRRLELANPDYLSFSNNTQFLLAESGQHFVVCDLENVAQYAYTAAQPIDQPQTHAAWMDGDRLLYVSGGKLEVFDYDNRNRQSLVLADPDYSSFFASDYSYLYALRPASAAYPKPSLTTTPLTVPSS